MPKTIKSLHSGDGSKGIIKMVEFFFRGVQFYGIVKNAFAYANAKFCP
jgi:hypothetical protein